MGNTISTFTAAFQGTMGIGACCAGWKALDLLFPSLKTMMTKLSPAAQAVLNAYRDADIDDAVTAAAVLRAAADQVVPLQLPPELDTQRPTVAWHAWDAKQQARFALLAIATELEAQ